jgi:hypothetical protein
MGVARDFETEYLDHSFAVAASVMIDYRITTSLHCQLLDGG